MLRLAIAFMPLVWLPQDYRDELTVQTVDGYATTNHYRMYKPDRIVLGARGHIWCWTRKDGGQPLGMVLSPDAGNSFAAKGEYIPLAPNSVEQQICNTALAWTPAPTTRAAKVTWEAPTQDTNGGPTTVLNYMLNYTKAGSGTWTQAWAGGQARELTVPGLEVGQQYTFQLFAQNTANQMSAPATVTTTID